jgi:HlyD family secretion protein
MRMKHGVGRATVLILTSMSLWACGSLAGGAPPQAATQPRATATAAPTRVAAAALTAAPTSAPTRVVVVPTALPVEATAELAQVVADARVVPASSAELSFGVDGLVAEVLVQEGQMVEQGEVLAKLSAADLQAQVDSASAALADAKANLARVRNIVGASNVQAAQADLEAAQATLTLLEAGPRPTDVQAAQAKVERAQANLQQERDQLSAAKNDAELEMVKAAEELRIAQEEYSRVFWNNENEGPDRSKLKPEAVELENVLKSRVEIARADLERARLNFELAQKAEVNGIEAARTEVVEAQAAMDRLMAGPDADKLAAARASVAKAESNLKLLVGAVRDADLGIAQARVEQRAADLAQVTAELERATLRAPFAGLVASSSLALGQRITSDELLVSLADVSTWRIETRDLAELDVAEIREGAPVTITFEALPDLILKGEVELVRPKGSSAEATDYAMYTVIVKPTEQDERLRWNMTATVAIDTQ